jgi:hypothetical protein
MGALAKEAMRCNSQKMITRNPQTVSQGTTKQSSDLEMEGLTGTLKQKTIDNRKKPDGIKAWDKGPNLLLCDNF